MANSLPRVKKPHYVPQFYLREWATGESIQVFDTKSRNQFPASIANAGSERAFYDDAQFSAICGETQPLEKFFQAFEDAGAKTICELLVSVRTGHLTVLPERARVDLAVFLGIQELRTKKSRACTGDLLEAISKREFLAYIHSTQPELVVEESWLEMEANERARFAAQLHFVSSEEVRVGMSAVFFNRYWLFVVNRSPQGFLTSDHPIVDYGDFTPEASSIATDLAANAAQTFLKAGIFRKLLPALLTSTFTMGPIIAFPLAPDVLLVMLDRVKYAKGASLDGQLQNIRNRTDLEFYNGLQVLQSYRQVYSRDANFDLAERLLEPVV